MRKTLATHCGAQKACPTWRLSDSLVLRSKDGKPHPIQLEQKAAEKAVVISQVRKPFRGRRRVGWVGGSWSYPACSSTPSLPPGLSTRRTSSSMESSSAIRPGMCRTIASRQTSILRAATGRERVTSAQGRKGGKTSARGLRTQFGLDAAPGVLGQHSPCRADPRCRVQGVVARSAAQIGKNAANPEAEGVQRPRRGMGLMAAGTGTAAIASVRRHFRPRPRLHPESAPSTAARARRRVAAALEHRA